MKLTLKIWYGGTALKKNRLSQRHSKKLYISFCTDSQSVKKHSFSMDKSMSDNEVKCSPFKSSRLLYGNILSNCSFFQMWRIKLWIMLDLAFRSYWSWCWLLILFFSFVKKLNLQDIWISHITRLDKWLELFGELFVMMILPFQKWQITLWFSRLLRTLRSYCHQRQDKVG